MSLAAVVSGSRPRRATVLPVIAGLLFVSALARIGDAQISDPAGPGRAADAAGTAEPQSAAACPPDPAIADLLSALAAREAALDERAARIADRMQALRLTEEVTAARLSELETVEAALSRTLTLADEAAEQDVLRLTAVYENMKPKTAAELFSRMPPGFAAGFLGRMRPEAAAAILSGLEPDQAYAISATLAGRNAAAPPE